VAWFGKRKNRILRRQRKRGYVARHWTVMPDRKQKSSLWYRSQYWVTPHRKRGSCFPKKA
jgi:hypothetical protein